LKTASRFSAFDRKYISYTIRKSYGPLCFLFPNGDAHSFAPQLREKPETPLKENTPSILIQSTLMKIPSGYIVTVGGNQLTDFGPKAFDHLGCYVDRRTVPKYTICIF
jgi:hypothetical protein